MSNRTRTVGWIEGKIISVLSQTVNIPHMSLSASVLRSINGGGIYSNNRTITMANCILWGNTAINGSQIYEYDSNISISYSNIQGGWEGEGNISSDPLFIRPPEDGDDGWGVGDNDDYGDLQLQGGSPCIDSGNNSAVPLDVVDIDDDGNTSERVPDDILSAPRFYDDPNSNDSGTADLPDYPYIVDMGAYEFVDVTHLPLLTIQVEPNDIGVDTIIPSVGQHPYYRNAVIEISAEPFPDCPHVWSFQRWQGDVIDPNSVSTQVLVDTDKTITAIYTKGNPECGDLCHPILPGDLNGDCKVNIRDFWIYTEHWLECTHPDCD